MPETTFEQLTQTRRNNIDFLRYLLATLVIFSHSFQLWGGEKYTDPLNRLTQSRMSFGQLAVDSFFILSGFLVARSWLQSKSTRDYLRKRIFRIYPGYIANTVIIFFLVGFLVSPNFLTNFQPKTLFHIFRGLPILDVIYPPSFAFAANPYPKVVNGSMWTIRLEFICYLVVILLGCTTVLRKRGILLVVFLAWFTFYNISRFHDDWRLSLRYIGDLSAMPRLLTYFLAGTVFMAFQDKIPFSRKLCALSWGVLIVSARFGYPITLPIFGTYLLFYYAFHPNLKLQNFGKRGDFSYGLYLYAFPVQQLLAFYFGKYFIPLTFFLSSWAVTSLFAAFSWFAIEKPCLQWKSRPLPFFAKPKTESQTTG